MSDLHNGTPLEDLYDLEGRFGVTVGSPAGLWAFTTSPSKARSTRMGSVRRKAGAKKGRKMKKKSAKKRG
jgi:hypothetical protein